MPPWLPHQQRRLAHEEQILYDTMPGFQIHDRLGDMYIAGSWVSNGGYGPYSIRIYVSRGYPDECPTTYITAPNPLLDHWDKPMTSWGTSHDMHTWETDRGTWLKLCTFKPAFWDARNSLVQVAKKALVWIVAYEEHRIHGKKISDLLQTMDTNW